MAESVCATCGHARDEHGDGVVHTACCFMPTGELFDMCDCDRYEETP